MTLAWSSMNSEGLLDSRHSGMVNVERVLLDKLSSTNLTKVQKT